LGHKTGRIEENEAWSGVRIGRMGDRGQLEVEVAVARGQELLFRVVFRPPEGFSIGSSTAATITIPDSPLPDRVEMLAFVERRPKLLFSEDSRLEVDADGERLGVGELLERGMAERGVDQHSLPLAEGVRAVVTLGALRVLLKVRRALDVSVWKLGTAELGVCGGCKSQVLWPSNATPGSLIPCPDCGDLNRVSKGSEEGGPTQAEQGLPHPAAQRSEPLGPDTAAFDDDDEATELESLSSSSQPLGPTEQLPGSGPSELGADVSPLPTSEVDEEAATDPGRDVREIDGPTNLPATQSPELVPPVTPTVDGPGFVDGQEPSLVPELPVVAGGATPTGAEFLAPRRRRPPPQPNYPGWGLVFFGMVSGLAGLVLLLLSALKL
jgi:hypothetical protein